MPPRTCNNFGAHLSCYISFFFFILSSSSSHAVSTLTQGQSLADGQTLVSAGAVFELGFFTPGKSTLRYLGIWYHPNISADQTVVWVANRASPIRGGSGARLTLSISGHLLLLDEANTTIWSTEAVPASNASTTARIEDNGNLLLLQDAGGGTLWQSFDHPTDTFLPGMKVGVNASTGRPQLFTAWQSTVDPSPGNYSMGLDPDGSTQIFIWARSGAKRWRSGQWNGHKFIGTVMRALFVYGFNYDNEGNYFTYTPHNSSLLRFVMGWSGAETTWMLVAETRQWKVVWGQPSDKCQVYGRCGDYGSCSYAGDVPTCSCLPGFVPRSIAEWSSGDWKGGCVRRTPLACQLNSSNSSKNNSNNGGSDGFFKMVGAKLPDYADWFTIGSEEPCRRACLSNCSCKAYAFGASDLGCMMWARDLIDIYQSSEFDYDLNIKLSASELEADMPAASNKKRLWRVIVTVTTLGSALVLLSCFFLCWKYNARLKARSKKRRLQDNILPSAQLSGEVISEFSCSSMYGEENQKGIGSELPLYTFECIGIATNYFSDSNKLGEGGFGYVYKGTLPGGQEVAIKRLSRSSGQGIEEFKNEVILISRLQHRNLVRLLGCCIKGEEKILIYEYLPNKSLDAILFDPSKKHLLGWKTRFNIIDGIARGLVYLHRDSRLRIVHRDLKASNILLDEIMNPKISDFGMAKIFGGDQNQGNTNRVVGTFGYMSPEYAMEGFFSVRSDVYSFGVLVLEIVTGQRNSSFYRMENGVSIIGHAWQMWSEGRAAELVDPSIRASSEMCQVLGCIHVALLCVQDRASDRPDIDSVICMITSEAGVLPMPRQPKFVAEGSPSATETTGEECGFFATSDVTMTLPQGR